MRFFDVRTRETKNSWVVFPSYRVGIFDDLMIRGGKPYAVFNYETGLWSTNMYSVIEIVDKALSKKSDELSKEGKNVTTLYLGLSETKMWDAFLNTTNKLPDHFVQLDRTVTFANENPSRKDYISKRLSYSLEDAETPAYDRLMSTLYNPSEREKIEWFIGSIAAKESKDIQKFLVLFGDPGTGKSTIINLIIDLFQDYASPFVAEDLINSSKAFSMEPFADNPLVAFDQDAKLSKVGTNTRLNTIVSHENVVMNEKYKTVYSTRLDAVLVVGTNTPIKITDAKSGLIRRILDAVPTGNKLSFSEYNRVLNQMTFERGAIAKKCMDVYKRLGRTYYDGYRPIEMIERTDYFFNFVDEHRLIFESEDSITLKRAFDMYKDYVDECNLEYGLTKTAFRDELKNYFHEFHKQVRTESGIEKNVYVGFRTDRFEEIVDAKVEETSWLDLTATKSLLDALYLDCKAQYANDEGKPRSKWENVTTTLKDLDTSKEHYVLPPDSSHIIVDFDLKNSAGEKSLALNMEAAAKFPPTYAELSKGGQGLHLHYIYDGDSSQLSSLYSTDVEIKVFKGNASLRRRVSKCNDLPLAHVSTGLPLKGEKMVDKGRMTSEKGVRDLIDRALRKEIFPNTKPSVDFIKKVLDDAYISGIHYDVRDMRPAIFHFALGSTNQSSACMETVAKMRFFSAESESTLTPNLRSGENDDPIVFFDCEVFPNLFLVNWKYIGKDQQMVRMINPSPKDIESLFSMKLVGFNNRRYDNHILYGRYLGYTNEELFDLSQRLVFGSRNATFLEAYNLSYTDVYDFASAQNKKGLKKWEIELRIHHKELGLPWDQPVPEEKWLDVSEYCDNDVLALEAVFNHLKGDWSARQILAELANMTVNDTTNALTTKIVFGDTKNPENDLVYVDLSTKFPGYEFKAGKSYYRGEITGEGGYVYAEPGIYEDVALLDIASMHPTSIEIMNYLGKHTKRYSELKYARVLIKHKSFDMLADILDGLLIPWIDRLKSGAVKAKDLSNALKTALNSAYGLTAAKFKNAFRHPKNIDNIVAKHGALFMVDLKNAVQELGYTVAHIKTDSIKIPNADDKIIDFVMKFGEKYGYTFEHEHTYKKMCLVNDAVYIAKDETDTWSPTGAQFAHPYIFKTLFDTSESLDVWDYAETKSVKSAIYLDMSLSEEEHDYIFVGRVGSFIPVKEAGGVMYRDQDGKMVAVGGSSGHRWMETEDFMRIYEDNWREHIDQSYYDDLMKKAISTIDQYGDWTEFCSEEGEVPWQKADIPTPLPF